jgi:molybdate/tungstate transport system substrate-binding protein
MLFSPGEWLARRLHRLARGRRIVPLLAVVLLGTAVLPASRATSPQTPVVGRSCQGDAGTTIRVLHAGSITNLVTGTMRPAFEERCGADVADLSTPSVALADGIKAGSISGDVFISADAHLNRTLMGPRNGDWARWFLVFGRNEEVITYSARSRFFADLEKARLGEVSWYQVVMEPRLVLGRTDPNTNPGGYYALFVAGLAERYYAIPGLKQRLLGADTNPAQLLAPPTLPARRPVRHRTRRSAI